MSTTNRSMTCARRRCMRVTGVRTRVADARACRATRAGCAMVNVVILRVSQGQPGLGQPVMSCMRRRGRRCVRRQHQPCPSLPATQQGMWGTVLRNVAAREASPAGQHGRRPRCSSCRPAATTTSPAAVRSRSFECVWAEQPTGPAGRRSQDAGAADDAGATCEQARAGRGAQGADGSTGAGACGLEARQQLTAVHCCCRRHAPGLVGAAAAAARAGEAPPRVAGCPGCNWARGSLRDARCCVCAACRPARCQPVVCAKLADGTASGTNKMDVSEVRAIWARSGVCCLARTPPPPPTPGSRQPAACRGQPGGAAACGSG